MDEGKIDCISLFANTHSGKMRKNRDLLDDYSGAGSDVQRLTFEQEMALDEIKKSIEKNEHRVFLLDGVTGSGKTEIYLRTVEKTLEKNKTAIVMVPEITLTKQLIDRFIYKLGKEKIAVIHSKLTKSEQREQWYDIKSGKKSVVIGARSACFAPLKNIGVIILDEEHDMSYKSQMTPKFHARDVAIRRGNINDGIVMLGSATPSVESMIKAHAGDYKRLVIKNRYNFVELPEVSVVDMREELKKGNTSIFSRKLYDEINRAIDSDKQVMLTINKKGYSTFVSCRNCGHVIKCQKCNVPMAYSKREDRLRCTYCGRVHNKVRVCPKCGSNYIKHFGAGTETVKEQVDKLFPNVKTRILELDETSTTDEVLEKIDVLNSDDTVHGVLIFRPLPKHIDDDKVRNRLKADKDVDGIGDVSMAKIYRGDTSGFAPCTAKACIEILKHFDVEIKGKKAVVIGRSMVIGKPVAMMLLNENATVTICHSKSEKLSKIIAENEIVISAVGRANTVTAECTCGNQKIIDVGINVHESGKMVGDVDFENVFGEVYGITPVPGGVGAVTTSILMDHVVRAAEMDCNRK